MSTASKVGSAFGALGSGMAAAGPIGMGIGAGFSLLGGLIGLGAQIKAKKEAERKQREAEAEAQRQSVQGQSDTSQDRTEAAPDQGAVPAQPVQSPMQQQGMQNMQQATTVQQPQQQGMSVELSSMVLGGGQGKSWWQS